MLNKVRELYTPDNRWGDNWIKPQRWCQRHWKQLFSPLNGSLLSKIGDVAKRMLIFIPLSCASLFAYPISLVGVGIKSFQDKIEPVEERDLDAIEIPDRRERVVEEVAPPERVIKKSLMDQMLYPDLKIHALSYLSRKDLLSFAQVSKNSKDSAYADILWMEELQSKRIWGPIKKYSLVRDFALKTYIWKKEEEEISRHTKINAKQQLDIYHKHEMPSLLMDYVIRQIPGGPSAYEKLPKLDMTLGDKIKYYSHLTAFWPQQLNSPMVRIENGFAIRFRDYTDKEPKIYIAAFQFDCSIGSEYFPDGKLKGQDIGYILRIIRGEPCGSRKGFLGENSSKELPIPEGRKTMVELV